MPKARKNRRNFYLVDAARMHKKYPDRFWFASEDELSVLKIGDAVKVCVNGRERVWLTVVDMDFKKPVMRRTFTGAMDSSLLFTRGPALGAPVQFRARNIYTYLTVEERAQGKIA